MQAITLAAYGTLPAQESTRLYQNDDVFRDERIATVKKSAAEIRFVDDTALYMGPSSELVLDAFIYDPDSTTGEFVVELGEGLFRFVSGSMPSQNYSIDTAVAVIGVRGTDLVLEVAESGALTVSVVDGAVSIAPKGGGAPGVASQGQVASVATADSSVSVSNAAVSVPASVSGDGSASGAASSVGGGGGGGH